MTVRGFVIAFTLCTFAACSPEQSAAPEVSASAEAAPAAIAAPGSSGAANVDGARITNANSEPGNWLSTGRTYDEQRYSPLDQINQDTAKQLGLAWHWDTKTRRGLEATPLVIDGVMYTSGSWSVVWAHNAKTGELLWEYDPQVPREMKDRGYITRCTHRTSISACCRGRKSASFWMRRRG